MREIHHMSKNGPVHAAIRYLRGRIDVSGMILDQTPSRLTSDVMKPIFEQFFLPAFEQVFVVHMELAFIPIRFVKILIPGTVKEHMRVPIPYDEGTYEYDFVKDERTGKHVLEVYDEDGDVIQHVYRCRRSQGPIWYNSDINSECGAILNEYRRYIRGLANLDEIFKRQMAPEPIVKKVTPAAAQPINEQEERYRAIVSTKRGPEGYRKAEPLPTVTKRDGAYWLPHQHDIAGFMPAPAPMVTEEQLYLQLTRAVASGFYVPHALFLAGAQGGGLSKANEQEVEMDKQRTSCGYFTLADDLNFTAKEITMDAMGIPIYSYIPVRPHATREEIIMLRDDGDIDPDTARDLIFSLMAIHPEYVRFGKARKKIRELIDKEDPAPAKKESSSAAKERGATKTKEGESGKSKKKKKEDDSDTEDEKKQAKKGEESDTEDEKEKRKKKKAKKKGDESEDEQSEDDKGKKKAGAAKKKAKKKEKKGPAK